MTDNQEILALTAFLRPFLALLLLGLICLPARMLIQRRMKDSKLKRLLLFRF